MLQRLHYILAFIVLFTIHSGYLLCQGIVAAENRRIFIEGVIINSVTEEPVPNVQYSIFGRGGGVSDQAGLFAFFAIPYDTIEFRMIGFRPTLVVIDAGYTAPQYLVLIALRPDTVDLGEVVVMPRLADLRSVAESNTLFNSREFENARGNINIAVHQGLTGVNQTGDPTINYEVLRRKQVIDAYEKGGIPSDKMASISPFVIVPAIYLLMNGLPEKPAAPTPRISNRELERLKNTYRELIYNRK